MNRTWLLGLLAFVLLASAWLAWISILRPDSGKGPSDPQPAFEPTPSQSRPSWLETPASPVDSSRVPVLTPPSPDASAPLIVAGTVLDPTGEPVAGASVSMFTRSPPSGSWAADGPTIRTVTSSSTTGRFEIRGQDPQGQAELVVWKEGYFHGDPIPFERGDADILARLRPCGSVVGRVIVDPGVPFESIAVSLSFCETDNKSRSPHSRENVTASGDFSFDGVCAEEVCLAFAVQDLDLPLTGLDAIRVCGVGESQDPRLAMIDLRRELRLLTIHVQDEQGRSLNGALVVARGQGVDDPDRSELTADGRARFLVRSGPCEFDVELLGYRREHLSGIETDSTVQLRPGIPVRVLVDAAGELPPDPHRLRVAALVAVESPLTAINGVGEIDSTRRAALLVGSPGVHEIGWFLDDQFLVGTPRQTVVIDNGATGQQEIHLYLAPEIVDAWKSRLRKPAPLDGPRDKAPAQWRFRPRAK